MIFSAPDVIFSSPDVIFSAPDVIFSSPDVTFSSPDAIFSYSARHLLNHAGDLVNPHRYRQQRQDVMEIKVNHHRFCVEI